MTDGKTTDQVLANWVRQALNLPGNAELTLIAGDASPRRYFRLSLPPASPLGVKTLVAVSSPPTEKNAEFLTVRKLLQDGGVRVPELIAADLNQGFMVLEDLGNDTLLPLLSEYSAGVWYAKGLNILADLVAMDHSDQELAPYNAPLLQQELDLFPLWFVQELLGLGLTRAQSSLFNGLSEVLIKSALSQPKALVHRDFHSRNLMVLNNADLAVIDFQDAVVGPITYDPVSLLKDCYIHWPRDRQLAWLADYQGILEQREVMSPVPYKQFVQWFDLMGLQRHIKVLGIFARLYLRDEKPGYLSDLPLVMAYTREALALYAEQDASIGAFRDWFEAEVVPACRQQAWFSSAFEDWAALAVAPNKR